MNVIIVKKRCISQFSVCFLLLVLFCLNISCNKYLDAKPDKTRDVPKTLGDCQALLDNYSYMNNYYPIAGEVQADNYWLRYANWQNQNPLVADLYVWGKNAEPNRGEWAQPYQVVFNANEVLEILEANSLQNEDPQAYKEIKGAALFYRAYAFYQLAQIFAPAYSSATATQPYGIVLRLSPDLGEKSVRSTVGETYDQIISDLKKSIVMLPRLLSTKQSRPGKAAAYGAMARTYLVMEDYPKAGLYADSALQINHTLMNYHDINPSDASSFQRFNPEVVFQAACIGNDLLSPLSALIDVNLYDSYESNDLRKTLFFAKTGSNPDVYAFRGSYEGVYGSAPFTGIANDELYLIRAECAARAGKTSAAMQDLNTLLKTRWAVNSETKQSLYQDLIITDPNLALEKILVERRKELIFRGLRWPDLRRLNRDNRFQITLTRELNGTIYSLPPNDPRYTMLIPFDVLNKTTIKQNPR